MVQKLDFEVSADVLVCNAEEEDALTKLLWQSKKCEFLVFVGCSCGLFEVVVVCGRHRGLKMFASHKPRCFGLGCCSFNNLPFNRSISTFNNVWSNRGSTLALPKRCSPSPRSSDVATFSIADIQRLFTTTRGSF